MSGHSKWSTIKRQKQATDQVRAQTFTKLGNAITVAVRESGGIADPNSNMRLRLAVEKARAANMPKDRIERAIARAQGIGAGEALQEIVYEGFAPGGVAVLIESVTDNPQRAVSSIKNIFSTYGGTLGGSGSVSYLFEKVGMHTISKSQKDSARLLELLMQINAENFIETESEITIFTKVPHFHEVKVALEKQGIALETSELVYRPKSVMELSDPGSKTAVYKLQAALEELDDVQKVFVNTTPEA